MEATAVHLNASVRPSIPAFSPACHAEQGALVAESAANAIGLPVVAPSSARGIRGVLNALPNDIVVCILQKRKERECSDSDARGTIIFTRSGYKPSSMSR